MKKRADWRWVWAAGIFMAVVAVALRLGNDEVKWVAAGLLASSAIAFLVWYLNKWTDWWWAGTAGIFVVMVMLVVVGRRLKSDEATDVLGGLLVLCVLSVLVGFLYREAAKRRKEAQPSDDDVTRINPPEKVIRLMLSKPTGELTKADYEKVAELYRSAPPSNTPPPAKVDDMGRDWVSCYGANGIPHRRDEATGKVYLINANGTVIHVPGHPDEKYPYTPGVSMYRGMEEPKTEWSIWSVIWSVLAFPFRLALALAVPLGFSSQGTANGTCIRYDTKRNCRKFGMIANGSTP